MGVQGAKKAKGIESGVVAVIPNRLQSVTSDEPKAAQFKALRAVTDVGALHLAKHVRFAAARRAGARTPELFERNIAFRAVVPSQRELVPDQFGAKRLESHLRSEFETILTGR
jgi:hypothetical protein